MDSEGTLSPQEDSFSEIYFLDWLQEVDNMWHLLELKKKEP